MMFSGIDVEKKWGYIDSGVLYREMADPGVCVV
jgi:hypothetical protein